MDITELDVLAKDECLRVLCGKVIGEGLSRTVYECIVNPKWVVKVEPEGSFQNVAEALLWWHASAWLQSWLAKVIAISPNGRVLVMERTKPVKAGSDKWPSRVPALLTDLKRDNWGWTGRAGMVCHDYGLILPEEGQRMRRAKWNH